MNTDTLVNSGRFHSELSILEDELLGGGRPYDAKDARDIFKTITASPTGYLIHQDVVDMFGKEKASKMVEHNLLHYRPRSTFARDLQPFPSYPVVTATGHPAVR